MPSTSRFQPVVATGIAVTKAATRSNGQLKYSPAKAAIATPVVNA
jgi:hypothetical protein